MPLATQLSWRIVGASVTGPAHLADGTCGQDAHAAARHDDGRLVLAVADGAGSAPRGAEGAALAVAAAVAHPDDPVAAARHALEANAGALLADLATTIVVVVIDDRYGEVWALGDGAAALTTDVGWEVPLPPATSGPVNETTFVTSHDWAEQVRVATVALPERAAVALLTDGLQLLALDHPSGAPFGPFFEPLLDFVRDGGGDDELGTFLTSTRVRARTDDDCTLLLAVAETHADADAE